jgi:putative nucleotidyltransferase with HDIG domain
MTSSKTPSGRPKKAETRSRYNYIDGSKRFLDWVNTLGFEQTHLGRIMHQLDDRFNVRQVALLFFFSLCLSFVVFYEFDFSYKLRVGEVATSDIKSPLSFQIVDEVATEEKRREAEMAIPPIFDYDPKIYDNLFRRIFLSFRSMRKVLTNKQAWSFSDADWDKQAEDFTSAYKQQFEQQLGHTLSTRVFEWLVSKRFSSSIENQLVDILAEWTKSRVYDAPANAIGDEVKSFLVRRVDPESTPLEFLVNRDEVRDIKQEDIFTIEAIDADLAVAGRDANNLEILARQLLSPNLTFNKNETASRREKSRAAVLPVQISIKKNQTIVSAGSMTLPIHATLVREINNLRSDRRTDFISLVSAILFTVLVLVFFSYVKRFTTNRVRVRQKDVGAMALVTLVVVVLTKMFIFLMDSAFLVRYGATIPITALLFAAPVAAGPMLVGLLVTSGELVWLFTAFLSIVLTFMVDLNFMFFTVSLIGGIAAARGVYACKTRNDIYWAGLRTGLINAVVITFLILFTKLGESDLALQLAWNVPAGLLGGMLSAMIAMMLVPILESAFNYTTDVKLLELASLNHPLMKDMIVKAPGTYHHSLVVGSMCEAAAESIGANALLAKVMAYYHDIGKMEHAQYFIENQRPGYNPHDHISPFMSKTVLVAHVKDGAEMGLKHKLGDPIIAGILQHHGTTLISFFYNKAIEGQDEDIDHIEPDDFRYPGPKPQFKEAALVMLADSIEAAARSLDDPTSGRLQSLVKNIIQSKFLDGQLEECNLTLKDLSIIEASFRRVILGVYHQRIDYPTANANRSESGKHRSKESDSHGRKGHHTA